MVTQPDGEGGKREGGTSFALGIAERFREACACSIKEGRPSDFPTGTRAEKALRKAQSWRRTAFCAAGFAVVMVFAGAPFIFVFAGAAGAVLNIIWARQTADLYGSRRYQRLERYANSITQFAVWIVLAIEFLPAILSRL